MPGAVAEPLYLPIFAPTAYAMTMFARLSIIFGLLLLSACSSEPEPVFDQPVDAKPALWEISGEAGSAYLFGTIHVLPENIKWRTDTLVEAMARSDWLLLELDPADTPEKITETFGIMATSHGQGSIDSRIRPALRNKAEKLFDAKDISESAFANIESWGAALMISSSAARGIGASSEYGVEKILTREFERRGKSIAGLESATQQFGYFDTMPEAEQRIMLEAVIESADDVVPNYRRLLTNWIGGDTDALREATSTGFLSHKAIRQAVIVDRNEAWAGQIAAILKNSGKTGFIAVGAGHLVGDDSVQAQLEKRGLKVTRIE